MGGVVHTGELARGQQQQVLRVPTHTGCQVVQLEQLRQLVGVALGVLQHIQQRQLTFHQGLLPTGDVLDGPCDTASDGSLAGCNGHGLIGRGLHGSCQVAEFVTAKRQGLFTFTLEALDLHVLTCSDPGNVVL